MKLLSNNARLTCKHKTGRVLLRSPGFVAVKGLPLAPIQDFVTIEGNPVLRRADPELCLITGCTNAGPTIKPCTLTLPAYQGYSSLVFIEGVPVCLETITGLTDGTPPGMVEYSVDDPGQSFVCEE